MTEEVIKLNQITKGNIIQGFSQLEYIEERKLERHISVNGKSPRINGKLMLQANDYVIQSHELKLRPYLHQERRSTFVDGNRLYYISTNASQNKYQLNDWYSPLNHKDPSNSALLKFYDKQSEGMANMAVTFAERQSAIDMIANKATKIFRAYRNVKRGKLRRAMKNLGIAQGPTPRSKQAAGQWLELQYGWLPLVGDIYTLSNLKPFAGGRITGTADATSQVGSGNKVTTQTRIVKYGADVIISDPTLAFSNNLGLMNPALVAWELVPFSFVVDWFLPVGDHINNLMADVGVTYRNSYKSTYDNVSIYHNEPRVYTNEYNFTQVEGCLGTYKRFSRAVLSKPPMPDLVFKNPLSPMHLANAIALGRQLKKE